MRTRRLSVAIAMMLALATPTAAVAQIDIPRGATVLDRSRVDYDPLGIRLGGFLLFSEIGIEQAYDSNVFAEPDNEEADLFTTIRPQFVLESQWSRHALNLLLEGEFRRHFDFDSEDRNDGLGRLTGRIDVSQEIEIRPEIFLERRTEGRGDVEDDGTIEEPRVVNVFGGQVLYRQRLQPLRLDLRTRYTEFEYESEDDIDRNRFELQVEPRVVFEVSERVGLFVAPEFELRDFETVVNDEDRDSINYGGAVGAEIDLSGILFGEMRVGASRTEVDNFNVDDSTQFVTSGDLTWNLTRLTTIRGQIDRRNFATTVAGSSTRVSTRFLIGVDHEFRRNIILSAETEYRRDRFTAADEDDTDTDDDTVDTGLSVDYRVNRLVSLFAEYEFRNRSSTDEDREFQRHSGFVGLRIRR